MKTALAVVALLLLGWAIKGTLNASADRARAAIADSTLAEFRDSLSAERAMRDRDRLDRERADSLAGVERNRLVMTLRGMRDSLASVGAASAAAFAAAPDSVKPLLDIFRDETRACRAALELGDSLHTLCAERVASRDATIRALDLTVAEQDSTIHALDASNARWRRIASPGLLDRLRRNLPLVAVVAAIGLTLGVILSP